MDMKSKGHRGKWRYNGTTGKLEPLGKKPEPEPEPAPFVRQDEVDAFENPVTGKMETSMSAYRRSLKEHGYFEKGNDRMHYEPPSREERMADIKDCVEESKRQIKYGMAPCTELERTVWDLQSQGRENEAREVWEKNRR